MRPWPLALVVLIACGSSGAKTLTPTTTAVITPIAATSTVPATTSTVPVTTIATTTTTQPAYELAVAECTKAASLDLPTKAQQGTAVLQKAIDVCKAAETAIMPIELTGPAGVAVNNAGFALLKLNIQLDKTSLLLEGGGMSKIDELDLMTAVLNFQTAAHEMFAP